VSTVCYRTKFHISCSSGSLVIAARVKDTRWPCCSSLLGQPHTNCVKTNIKTWDKRNKSWRQHHDSDRCAAVFIISFVSTVLLSLRHVTDIVSWLLHVLTHASVRRTWEKTALLKVKYFSKICCTENSKAVYLVTLLSLHFEISRECHIDFIDGGQLQITEMMLVVMTCFH
jgi:hypothetical protein